MEATLDDLASALLSERPDRLTPELVDLVCRSHPESEDLCLKGVRRQHVFHLLERIPRWNKNWEDGYKRMHTDLLKWLQQLRDDLAILEEPAPAKA